MSPALCGIHADQRAVLDLPAGADVVLLEIMPAVEILAVEEQLPAVGLFLVGEFVDVGVIIGKRAEAGGEGQSEREQKCAFHSSGCCIRSGIPGKQKKYRRDQRESKTRFNSLEPAAAGRRGRP